MDQFIVRVYVCVYVGEFLLCREKAEELTLMTTYMSMQLDRMTPDLSFVNKPCWTLVVLRLEQ